MRMVRGLLDRCLEALELLASEANWLRLSHIAIRLELEKGPTHRLLAQLVELGWVEQDEATERYRLTLKLTLLGQQYLHGTGIPGLVQPILDEVAAQCRELVRMTVVDGNGLRWFASSQGAAPGLMYSPAMTGPIALHATANGKAWLACLPDEAARRIALESGFENPGAMARLGPNAVHTVERLMNALATTRRQGYGLSVEEAEPGVTAIAVALCSTSTAQVFGTMSIAGPLLRVVPERYAEFHGYLVAAAQKITKIWPRQPAQLRAAA